MSKTVLITLNSPVSDTFGPNFNLTANVGTVTPSTATLVQLTDGYLFSVDSAATQVIVTSTNPDCPSSITFDLPDCRCNEVEITGTVTLSYTTSNGDIVNETYSDVTVNICAVVGSITFSGTGSAVVTPSSKVCVNQIDCWEEFIMEANQLPAINGIQIQSTGKYAIEWEPGVYDIYPASNTSRTHTYSTPYTGLVKIKAPSLTFITKIILTTSSISTTNPIYLHIQGPQIAKLTNLQILDIGYQCNARLYCDTTDLSHVLTQLKVYKGTVTGDIVNLASTLTNLSLYGTTTVYGDIQDLPPNLITCDIYGTNNVNGDLANLPPSLQSTLKVFRIEGSNDITGNIGSLGGFTLLETFRFLGDNTITGNISGISTLVNMKTFDIFGNNRLLGNISAISGWTQCTRFTVGNPYPSFGTIGNELTGNLSSIPASMEIFRVYKYNTIGGNLSSIPSGMSDFIIIQQLSSTANITGNLSSISSRPLTTLILQGGSFTFTGDIIDLPSTITDCWLDTSGVITGDVALLPTNITAFSVYTTNNASLFTYTPGRTWASPMRTLDIDVASAVPKITTVDDLVIDLANSTWTSVTLPSTWGLKLKGPLVSPAAIAAKNAIQATPTNVTIYL